MNEKKYLLLGIHLFIHTKINNHGQFVDGMIIIGGSFVVIDK